MRVYKKVCHWFCMLFSEKYRYDEREKRKNALLEFYAVIYKYMPQIKDEIEKREHYFNLWEYQNVSPKHGKCAEDWILPAENQAKEKAKKLYGEMIRLIYIVEARAEKSSMSHKRFIAPTDPSKKVGNSYPGELSAFSAIEYCKQWIEEASRYIDSLYP